MVDSPDQIKEYCEVPEEAVHFVDANVLKAIPGQALTTSISIHGHSHWTRTARIDVSDEAGGSRSYFLKTSHGSTGRQMVHSEFTAMSTIATITPTLIPTPISHGQYASDPTISFFLSTFHSLSPTLPSIPLLTKSLAHMHRTGTSQNGKFGFAVPTFHGTTRIEHPWCDTWEEYFTVTTRKLLEVEQEKRGRSGEVEGMRERLFGEVVPRLLRPLETGGKRIRPSLIHGDLWDGNVGGEGERGMPVVFDAACFYAHNEYELGVWRQAWNKLGEPEHFAAYLSEFPKSEPQEDFEDRNELYAVVDILDSILYTNENQYRENLIRGMRSLVERHCKGASVSTN